LYNSLAQQTKFVEPEPKFPAPELNHLKIFGPGFGSSHPKLLGLRLHSPGCVTILQFCHNAWWCWRNTSDL